MYPEKEIFDVAGHRRIVAADLVRELSDQAMQYRPEVVLNERVTGLRILGERAIELTTPAGRPLHPDRDPRAGCGAFVPRKLDIPNLIDFEGTGSSTSSLVRTAPGEKGPDRRRGNSGGGLGALPRRDRRRGDPLPPDVQVARPRGDGPTVSSPPTCA